MTLPPEDRTEINRQLKSSTDDREQMVLHSLPGTLTSILGFRVAGSQRGRKAVKHVITSETNRALVRETVEPDSARVNE